MIHVPVWTLDRTLTQLASVKADIKDYISEAMFLETVNSSEIKILLLLLKAQPLGLMRLHNIETDFKS